MGWLGACAAEADKGLLRARTSGREPFDLAFCCLKGVGVMYTKLNACRLPVLNSNTGKQYLLTWVP